MNEISQHFRILITAAKPLPMVVRKPVLLKLWLFNPARTRIFLFTGLLIFLFTASPMSQSIVDAWHPLDQNSLKTGVMELFNSPILRKQQDLRQVRYWQFLIFFWMLGLSVALIILILDLPRSIKAGEQMSAELLQQSDEVRETNPLIYETLTVTAENLRLYSSPPDLSVEKGKDTPAKTSLEVAKTRAIPKAETKARFVGSNQRYRIDKAIASGGAGVVYQAEDTVLGRKVALKELLEDLASDVEQAERFKSEARALALLNHRHILPIYDLLEENGRFWLVMELLTAGTLSDKIGSAGTLDKGQIIKIAKGIASGLEFAHQQGFVHRDI
jgi:hypothetical protein